MTRSTSFRSGAALGPVARRLGRSASALGLVMAAGVAAPVGVLQPRAVGAQVVGQAPRSGNYTRPELEAAAQEAERSAGNDARKRAAAAALRDRLQSGDFSPGDRVYIELRGDSAIFDTLTVRSGPTLRLPNIPDVPLKGVLRSELPDYLTKYLSRYIREPNVRVETLIRLSMMGQVGKPGFYDFNSDVLLTDAIMAAGGPTGSAAIERSTIRRGTAVVAQRETVRRAAQTGATLDRLGLRPGDEVTIGEKRQKMSLQSVLGVVGGLASLALTALWLLD